MAIIREHLAAKGLGLHNDLQTEHSIVGNNPFIIMFKEFATPRAVRALCADAAGRPDPHRLRPDRAQPRLGRHPHGDHAPCARSATARAGWLINGEKMWTTGMHVANYIMCFARTAGQDGDADGLTVFLVPASDPGVKIEEYLWTFNMPTDHPRVSIKDVWVSGRGDAGAPRARACGWARASCTRTASARRPRRSARRSTASRRASSTPAPASRSASRSATTRPSSGRWSSCTPSARCCAC